MSHMFISHKREDSPFANDMRQRIEDRRHDVWMDSNLKAGEDWRREIDQAIQDAFAMIVILTPAASRSEYVTYEWSSALAIGVKVIPVLLEDTTVHPRLNVIQYLDFRQEPRPWDELLWRLKEVERLQRDEPTTPEIVTKAVRELRNDTRSADEKAGIVLMLGIIRSRIPMQELLATLPHTQKRYRRNTIWALGEIGDPTAIPHLRRIIKEAESVEALAKIGDNEALETLQEESNTTDLKLQGRIEHAVKQMIPNVDSDVLITALERNPSARQSAAIIAKLGVIGDDAAVPILRKIFTENRALRKDALKALLAMGEDVADDLMNLYNSNQFYYQGEFFALLDEIETPGFALTELIKAFSGNTGWEAQAQRIISKIGEEAVPQLAKVLRENPDKDVRRRAALVMGQIGHPSAIPWLSESLNDRAGNVFGKERVCDASKAALERIGTPEALEEVKNWRERAR